MFDDKYYQRLTSLFADIERLASDPNYNGNTIKFRGELEALRTRLLDLEAQFMESRKSAAPENSPTPPDTGAEAKASQGPSGAFEKDRTGYIYAGGELESIPGQELPELAGGRTLPLIASGQEIGEVLVETDRSWTAEEANLASMVAYQASLQIQNLRLLAATERARTQALEATRQFTQKNWESFLDAINKEERIGYAYNQVTVESSPTPDPAPHDHVETVQILDEQIGRLFIKADERRPITAEDRALIGAIAQQVGQQVENIRLLAEATRARAEAEDASRRLTRQNWESFAEDRDATIGFVYDSNKVTPIGPGTLVQSIAFEQPLVVRGEPIGNLAVAGMQNISQEAKDLATAIATQTSIHLETLRLTEELQKRAQELKELDRLKSAFLANMSHELRTPLNSILGFTDVMLEGLDGELTQYMDNDLRLIQKNGQHLLHLINDVLDMAKIESGRMNLHPEKFKVHDLLDEVTSITSTLASEKNNALYVTDDSDRDLEIYADDTRIRQVMINLVNNAIKFTTNGRITLHVSRLDSTRVLITVKDTGTGIPHDHLEAIFQEFTQVDTSTTRKVGGTGLGLPISRRLIEMHGGRLWAESTGIDGEGSTFYVELPIEARITEVIEKKEK